MSARRSTATSASLRARRWDAVVLGSSLYGLVAAARLGMSGLRVLVVEEGAARAAFPGLREPFFLSGARDGGALDACLRELTLPLIDRRRVVAQPLSYQVIAPRLRLDVGEAALTADELVAWGVAKPERARALVKALTDAAEAERRVLLDAPLVRSGRRLSIGRAPAQPGTAARGLPAEAAAPDPELAPILEAQARALSNLPRTNATPEAQARLLGSPLFGGAGFDDGPPWLTGLMRRRVESVYGEFRTLPGRFEFVTVDHQPAIAPENSKELWVGRALLLAAPLSALAREMDEAKRPEFMRETPAAFRRRALHWRVRRSLLPEALSTRAILVGDPHRELVGANCITLSRHAIQGESDWVDLVARSSPSPLGSEPEDSEIEAAVRGLLPFAEEGMVAQRIETLRWDDPDWLEDAEPGAGWPGEVDIRIGARPPVYRLDRAAVASLGVEGDLLLGWRAGDAVAADLG